HPPDRKRRNRRFGGCLQSCPGTAWALLAPDPFGSQTPPGRAAGCIATDKPDDFFPVHRASALPPLFHRPGDRCPSIIPDPSLQRLDAKVHLPASPNYLKL